MSWEAENRRVLTDALGRVRAALEAHAARIDGGAPAEDGGEGGRGEDGAAPADRGDGALPRLDALCSAGQLSPFEQGVLLLCAGMEIDASFGALCARAGGDPRSPFPTFGLALASLPEPHWDALAPSAPLRRWALVEVEPDPVLTRARLRVPARVWQYLLGIDALDERLARYVSPAAVAVAAPSQDRLAREVASTAARAAEIGRSPVVQLCGRSRAGVTAVAAGCVEHLGAALLRLPEESLPPVGEELQQLVRLLQRESILGPVAVLIDGYEAGAGDAGRAAVLRIVSAYPGFLVVIGRERRPLGGQPVASFDVESPTFAEQRACWVETIAAELPEALDAPPSAGSAAEALAGQFDLDIEAIHAAAVRAAARVAVAGQGGGAGAREALWDACRAETRGQIEDLAQRIDARVDWADLVLPEAQLRALRDVEVFVKRRAVVDAWYDAAGRGARGMGTSVLFSGPSGTGKTLAAEVLARRLRLDLYRIDLSAVVSKYIGETEKNLRRVFDAAEHGGSVLLFDEADALFAKRSEVRDSHDRYANVEVGYLLQRIEAFRGLCILTTNMKSSIDQAFLRRLRIVVDFPFPDEAQRAAIWSRVFPPGAPTARLDFATLARLNVSGASIRGIAVHALHLAADDLAQGARGGVGMDHLLVAARREYEKLQQPLTKLETKGWA